MIYLYWNLTFAVLAARAARGVAVAGELVVRRRLAGEGVRWVRLVGEGVHHGPRGRSREGQGSQSVLVWGSARAVIVIQGQVCHVWAGDKREEMKNGRSERVRKCLWNDTKLNNNNKQPQKMCLWASVCVSVFHFTHSSHSHLNLQRHSNTAQRRWSCWRCVGWSRLSAGCWRTSWLHGGPGSLRCGGRATPLRLSLREEMWCVSKDWS